MIAERDKCDAIAPSPDSMDYYDRFVRRNADSPTIDQSADNGLEKIAHQKGHVNPGPSALYTLISPGVAQEHNRKRKSVQREEELHVLALSEAQMKVDIAAMLKEEARIKLEEAHYRKEEARLRMLLFTYKLDRIKDEWSKTDFVGRGVGRFVVSPLFFFIFVAIDINADARSKQDGLKNMNAICAVYNTNLFLINAKLGYHNKYKLFDDLLSSN